MRKSFNKLLTLFLRNNFRRHMHAIYPPLLAQLWEFYICLLQSSHFVATILFLIKLVSKLNGAIIRYSHAFSTFLNSFTLFLISRCQQHMVLLWHGLSKVLLTSFLASMEIVVIILVIIMLFFLKKNISITAVIVIFVLGYTYPFSFSFSFSFFLWEGEGG